MNRTECLYEKHLKKQGFIQIYDGETAPQKQSDQFAVDSEERRFFVRYYQLVQNNHMMNEYVKLVYDLRSDPPRLKCLPEHYHKLPSGLKQVQNIFALSTIRT